MVFYCVVVCYNFASTKKENKVMRTTAICPISDKKIDDHVARINGAFTVLFLSAFIITGNLVPILFLFVDFALRSGKYSRFSVFSFLSRKIIKLFSIKPELINAGPKIFAARIGFVFNILILSSVLFGLDNLSIAFTGVFGACAILESVFGYCVACQIYPLVYKLTFHSKIQKLKI